MTTICKLAKIAYIKNQFLHIKFRETSHFMVFDYASDMQLLVHWPVSERAPGHKSMGCQEPKDVMGLV